MLIIFFYFKITKKIKVIKINFITSNYSLNSWILLESTEIESLSIFVGSG